jgi:Ca2+/Na+ antiporter
MNASRLIVLVVYLVALMVSAEMILQEALRLAHCYVLSSWCSALQSFTIGISMPELAVGITASPQ